MESQRILLSLLMVGIVSSATGLLGGYKPIKDPMNPYVVDIAKYAVREHNENAFTNLVFVKVLSGEEQVVSGTNYKLNIKVGGDGDGEDEVYQAVVYDSPSQKFRALTSFTKLEKKN